MGRKQSKKLIQKFVKRQKVAGKTGTAAAGVKAKSLAKTSKGARAIESSKKKSGVPAVQSLIAKEFKKRKRSGADQDAVKDAKTDKSKAPKRKLFDDETGKAVAAATKNGGAADDGGDSAPNAINGAMSIEDFLAGGFKAAAADDDDSDDSDREDEEDDDDDEEEEDEEEEEKSAENANSDGEASDDSDSESEIDEEAHKAELEALKEKDPEFYKYLQEENAELLEFGNEDDEASDEENEENAEEEVGGADNKTVVSFAYLRKLDKELSSTDKVSLKMIRTIARIFGAVVAEATTPEGEIAPRSTYRIPNELAKERVIRIALSRTAAAFDGYLSLQRPKVAGRRKIVTSHKLWGKLSKVAAGFLSSALKLMSSTVSEELQAFILRRLPPYGIYICALPTKVLRKFVKTLTAKWGAARTSDRNRLLSFACLRRLATECGPGNLPELLKPIYLEFVRGAKDGSVEAIGRIAMQAKCLVDLFGIDLSVTYQLAFVYIRQLALHLRAAIISKTSESTRGVYGWQFIHCLRLWGVVLSSYPGTPKADEKGAATTADDHQLRSLIYPLIQVIIGTIRLAPAARNFPVRFHCVAVLNNLARSSRYFVPCTPLLLDVLACKELRERPAQTTMFKEPKLTEMISLKKNVLAAAPAQIAIVHRTLELLEDYLDCYRFSIGFPETAFPVLAALRSFRRKCKLPRARDEIKALLTKVQGWVDSVKQQREKSDFTPSNVARMNAFLREEEDAARAQRALDKAAAAAAAESTELDPMAVIPGTEADALEDDVEDDGEDGEEAAVEEEEDDDDDDDEEEEEEEEKPAKASAKSKKQKTQKPPRKAAARAAKQDDDDDDDEEGDIVEDMEMSSDEE